MSLQQTPVMLAAKGGFLHCVKALIESKADITLLDANHQLCEQICSVEHGQGCLRTIQQAKS